MKKRATQSIALTLLGIIMFLTFGCEAPFRKTKQSINLAKESQRANQKSELLATAQSYLQLSKTTSPPKSQEYELMAADMYTRAGQLTDSMSLLDKVSDSALDVNLKIYKQIIFAEIALAKSEVRKANEILNTITLSASTKPDMRSRVYFLQAKTYETAHQYLDAARTRSNLEPLLTDQQSQMINRQAIQADLNYLSKDILNQAAHHEDYPFSGWLSFAYIDKAYTNPFEKKNAFQTWLQQNTDHPAHALIPLDDETQTLSIQQNPNLKKIALLLPMSGPHAKAALAIRQGFFSAYYEAPAMTKPTVQVYDTTNQQDILQVYQRAVDEGADFVVGPLIKEDVVRLSQMPFYTLKTPVLALNEHPNVRGNRNSFIQFSLAPEQEANQITEKAKRLGFQSASIVVPSNAWGQRLAKQFRSSWQQAGGHIVSEVQLDPHKDLAKQLQKFLSLEESQSRSSAIKQMLKEPVDFQLRRRKDLDVIFMALPPELARQIKPLFDFYYAHDIPILATSSVYSGSPNATKDRDMNGIQFVDMPWVVDTQKLAEKQKIDNVATGESSRLFAMGIDAYRLANRLNELQQSPAIHISGVTGVLSVSADNRVQRTLSWAKIANGTPTLIQ